MYALRLPEVQLRTGLSKSSIYRFVNANDFPKPFRLGANIVVWDAAEVSEWLESRREQSRQCRVA